MLDNFLNVGAAFDWITPLIAFVQDFFEGPVSDFGIPANGGWSSDEIKHVLEPHGVRVWGLMLNLEGDLLMFTVPRRQTKQAYSLLKKSGVPVRFGP